MFHDRRRILINQGAIMTIETTSTSSSWSPFNITNNGSTLIWEVSGGVTIPPITINDPTFDLSSNTGVAIVTAKDVSNVVRFDFISLAIADIDLSKCVDLESLGVRNGNINNIDLSTNLKIEEISVDYNNLTYIDISNNPLITFLRAIGNPLTPTSIDSIIIDLDNHGLSNGTLFIPTGRTSASLTAYNSLIAKGWTITES